MHMHVYKEETAYTNTNKGQHNSGQGLQDKTTQTALSGQQMVWIKTYKYICRTLTNNKIPMWQI